MGLTPIHKTPSVVSNEIGAVNIAGRAINTVTSTASAVISRTSNAISKLFGGAGKILKNGLVAGGVAAAALTFPISAPAIYGALATGKFVKNKVEGKGRGESIGNAITRPLGADTVAKYTDFAKVGEGIKDMTLGAGGELVKGAAELVTVPLIGAKFDDSSSSGQVAQAVSSTSSTESPAPSPSTAPSTSDSSPSISPAVIGGVAGLSAAQVAANAKAEREAKKAAEKAEKEARETEKKAEAERKKEEAEEKKKTNDAKKKEEELKEKYEKRKGTKLEIAGEILEDNKKEVESAYIKLFNKFNTGGDYELATNIADIQANLLKLEKEYKSQFKKLSTGSSSFFGSSEAQTISSSDLNDLKRNLENNIGRKLVKQIKDSGLSTTPTNIREKALDDMDEFIKTMFGNIKGSNTQIQKAISESFEDFKAAA